MHAAMTMTTTMTTSASFVPRTRALRRVRRAGVSRSHAKVTTTTRAAVVDPATKVSFDDTLDGLTCIGAGVREKKIAIVSVKVGGRHHSRKTKHSLFVTRFSLQHALWMGGKGQRSCNDYYATGGEFEEFLKTSFSDGWLPKFHQTLCCCCAC